MMDYFTCSSHNCLIELAIPLTYHTNIAINSNKSLCISVKIFSKQHASANLRKEGLEKCKFNL